ncbi:PocR ligand-binding domain-containing protein [Methanosarcina horonobensis]
MRLKLEDILSPAREPEDLQLAEIVDVKAIQSLMDDFYKLAQIPMSLDDLKGNVLVGIGWQDICTKFHRIHPETCRHCVESDTELSTGVLPAEFKLYRCKNNMWDVVTPIIVGGQHVGNIFSGQFFFEDESVDYKFFRSQAKKYGFNEKEYITALEKVPRLSREAVDTGMAFLMKLANMISQLSYSNIKLAQSLVERDAFMDAMQESERRERARSDELSAVLDAVPAAVWMAHDPGALQITGNRLSYEWLQVPEGTNVSKSASGGERLTFRLFKDGAEIPLADMPLRISAAGIELNDYEFDIKTTDGALRHLLGNARPLRDEQGKIRGSISAFIDITERKRTEETLAFERSQLLSIFDGIDDVVYVTDPYTCEVLYANKAMKEKFGGELIGGICYREFQRRDSPCDFCTNPVILKERGKPYHWEYYNSTVERYFMIMDRIIKWPDGRDVRFEIAKDITERKKTEEALQKAYGSLEEKVKERTAELEKAYKALVENERRLSEAQRLAHIGIWDWNLETDEIYWSDETFRILGCNPRRFGLPYSEILKLIHPDDREHADDVVNRALKGNPFSTDLRIILDDGEDRVVHAQGEAVFDEKNNPLRIRGTVQDITESKKAEEKIKILADAVESSDDAIITESLDGIVTSWNKGAEQIYGYSAEEILEKNVSILEPDDRKGEIKHLTEKIKHKEKIQRFRTLRLKKDGTIINISVTYSPIFDASGEPVAVSAIARDITERIRAEETLAKIEEARKKEIHHRIKNNLQVISSLLDLQSEKFQDKAVLEAFRESQSRVLSMSLIHEELYKGEGTDTLDFSTYLQKLAENLFQTYTLFSKSVHLCMDLEENAYFNMDIAVPLGIIVNELVSNSLKHAFTENQEGEIRIQLCREEKSNEMQESLFSLTISDNGKGIPENIELESLETLGTLGLQLVSTLVDQMDGKVEPRRDHGTEFRITFKITENNGKIVSPVN